MIGVVESKEFPGYFVTPDGRIFSEQQYGPHRPGQAPYKGRLSRELKRSLAWNKRYLAVTLVKGPKEYRVGVHKLVAECYLPPKPFEGAVVRHLDGDAFNNWFWNFAWGSRQDDANDRVMHGTTPVGSRNHSAKLTENIVREMRRRYGCGERTANLAEEFCISQVQVRNVVSGRCWKNV